MASLRVSSSTGCAVTVGAVSSDAAFGDDEDSVGPFGVGHEVGVDRDGQPQGAGCHISQQTVPSLTRLQCIQRPDGSTALPR